MDRISKLTAWRPRHPVWENSPVGLSQGRVWRLIRNMFILVEGTYAEFLTPKSVRRNDLTSWFSGAGNWSSSRELSESESIASTTDPTSVRSTSANQGSGETRYIGRGGAGNYQWNAEKEARAKQEIEQKEFELKELVKKDVETGLTPPNKAYLGNENSWQ